MRIGDLPAATALVFSNDMIVECVLGTNCAVAAIQRERWALKDSWSLSQVPCGLAVDTLSSQADSVMTSSLKKMAVPFKRPLTRFAQTAEPFVWERQNVYDPNYEGGIAEAWGVEWELRVLGGENIHGYT